MSNFTPIAVGAAANAATINDPLYQLDAAIIYLQSIGAITANRPWGIIGGLAQPTSSTAVAVTDDITHTGKMVRGQTTITSTGATFENRGNFANGSGNNVMSASDGMANGAQNTVSGSFALASGQQNVASGTNAITAGSVNTAGGNNSAVFGTTNSIAAGSTNSNISGGSSNSIAGSSLQSGIGTGSGNQINASTSAFIGGGGANFIQQASNLSAIGCGSSNNTFGGAINAFTGGGLANYMSGSQGFIGAGGSNQNSGAYGAVVTGYQNQNRGTGSAILTGNVNIIQLSTQGIDPIYSAIVGGVANKIYDSQRAFIGGGDTNFVNNSSYSGIGVGFTNTITNAAYAMIACGNNNSLNGTSNAFIGGGSTNTITSNGINSAILGGLGNNITAGTSSVIGGNDNTVTGSISTAGGVTSRVNHNNMFMWNSDFNTAFNSAAHGEFAVTAYGGFRFFTNTARTTGMTMAAGASSWTAVSSRALKGHFANVAPVSILERLLTIPIQTWRFKDGDNDYHEQTNLGPVAEDWDGAFADLLGKKTVVNVVDGNELHTPAINEGDKMGVALAAIQGLASLVADLRSEVAALNNQLKGLNLASSEA